MDAQARADALSELQKAGKLDAAPEVLASAVVQKLKEKCREQNLRFRQSGCRKRRSTLK
jgi:hypothetical protein